MKAIIQDTVRPGGRARAARRSRTRVVGEQDVLIQVRAAGAGPDVWHIMTGKPYMARPVLGFRRPKDPVRGWDVAGTVETVGARVDRVPAR